MVLHISDFHLGRVGPPICAFKLAETSPRAPKTAASTASAYDQRLQIAISCPARARDLEAYTTLAGCRQDRRLSCSPWFPPQHRGGSSTVTRPLAKAMTQLDVLSGRARDLRHRLHKAWTPMSRARPPACTLPAGGRTGSSASRAILSDSRFGSGDQARMTASTTTWPPRSKLAAFALRARTRRPDRRVGGEEDAQAVARLRRRPATSPPTTSPRRPQASGSLRITARARDATTTNREEPRRPASTSAVRREHQQDNRAAARGWPTRLLRRPRLDWSTSAIPPSYLLAGRSPGRGSSDRCRATYPTPETRPALPVPTPATLPPFVPRPPAPCVTKDFGHFFLM